MMGSSFAMTIVLAGNLDDLAGNAIMAGTAASWCLTKELHDDPYEACSTQFALRESAPRSWYLLDLGLEAELA